VARTIKNVNQSQPKPKKGRRLILFLAIMLIAVWVVWTKAKEAIVSRMVPTIVVHEGVLERRVPVEVLVIREEKIITAPAAGDWNPVAMEGDRIRVGGLLGEIIPVPGVTSGSAGSVPVLAPVAGTVYYALDGIEAVLAPRKILTYDWNFISDLKAANNPIVYQPREIVIMGQPVAKIINNLSLPLFFVTGQEDSLIGALDEGCRVNLILNNDTSMDTIVLRWRKSGSEINFLLQALSLEKIPMERIASGEMVLQQWQGIIVPVKAIAVEEGRSGVLLVRSHGIVWYPVEIKGSFEGQAAVSGLAAETRIIADTARFLLNN
jgi:putative membrane fusion protein